MFQKVLNCLVQIKYEGRVTARRLQCVVSGNERLLIIPLRDYPAIRDGGGEMMLHMHEDFFERCDALPDYDLFCPQLIDLDNFDELPWMEVPTVVGV